MPYLLMTLGILIGLFALARFFLKAKPDDIKALIMAAFTMTICLALFILSVTGRLPAAIAIVSALAPFGLAYYSSKKRNSTTDRSSAAPLQMNRDEALKILGLENTASEEDVQIAYKTLMKKLHPDQQGSEWMARKLNEARDYLIKSVKRP